MQNKELYGTKYSEQLRVKKWCDFRRIIILKMLLVQLIDIYIKINIILFFLFLNYKYSIRLWIYKKSLKKYKKLYFC